MNYKKFTIASFLLIGGLSTAQVKPKTAIEASKPIYTVYKQAKDYADGASMINALHQIIAIEGSNSTYKDTLAITYYKMNNPLSCHLVVKELLEKKPSNLVLLELDAMSLQQLNAKKEAITAFEKLFGLSKNKYHGYQLAILQQSIKRLAEAQLTINQAIACEDIKGAELDFPVDKNNTQKVSLNAAIMNVKGLIAYELKDTASAKKAFEEAVKISPDFVLAKQNAEALEVELTKK
jgi:tetratricopeptide (TPR) repeat protein